ncbi:MAG: amino acid decarboxylase [Alicyclobacillus sp.]|nr:amino acid decarboxylase [Alicyclobacillus sp.]
MDMTDLVLVERDGARLIIDARDAIRKGHHPRGVILHLVEEAPSGTLCEIHVPHRTGPLISALQNLGMNVAVAELEPGHFRLRVLKA